MKLFEQHETERAREQLPEMPPDVQVPDDISGLRRPTTQRPTADRIRWIRWVAAIVLVGAVGGIAAMLLSSSETDVAPTAVDYMEIYGTDNPVILQDDAVAGTVEIVGTVDYMELYGTDNPAFVETTPRLMELYGTDNPEFVEGAPYMELYGTDNPAFVEDAEFMELYGTDNPEFVEEADVAVYTGEYFELYGTDNPAFVAGD